MHKIIIAVLLMFGVSYSALAEKILCVDVKHKAHVIEFVTDSIDFVYLDGVEYQRQPHMAKISTEYFTSDKKMLTFFFDPNPENRDWFNILLTSIPKKNEKVLEDFFALCDNVNLLEEEQQPQLVKQ
ncbi:hypothetical protein SEPL_458 [Salmonella phage SE_PL]|nr:hypothetical protein 7t3_096 [Salmonella phage 7t3]QIG63071.1 hypothetical protein SEPL_458 [Salmonella phage SE_PL]